MPPEAKVLPGKWVYKNKLGPDGSVARRKAGWVIKGFAQRSGVDYDELYAPVAKITTTRVLLALAALHDLEIDQLDIKTAFLYGELSEEIYVDPPIGFEVLTVIDCRGKKCFLKKALYGLKQAPGVWYQTLSVFLKEQGLQQSNTDVCLYINTKLWFIVYVEDVLIFGKNSQDCSELKKSLAERFEVTDLSPIRYYLVDKDVRLSAIRALTARWQ
jgi:hypothetical protein